MIHIYVRFIICETEISVSEFDLTDRKPFVVSYVYLLVVIEMGSFEFLLLLSIFFFGT